MTVLIWNTIFFTRIYQAISQAHTLKHVLFKIAKVDAPGQATCFIIRNSANERTDQDNETWNLWNILLITTENQFVWSVIGQFVKTKRKFYMRAHFMGPCTFSQHKRPKHVNGYLTSYARNKSVSKLHTGLWQMSKCSFWNLNTDLCFFR